MWHSCGTGTGAGHLGSLPVLWESREVRFTPWHQQNTHEALSSVCRAFGRQLVPLLGPRGCNPGKVGGWVGGWLLCDSIGGGGHCDFLHKAPSSRERQIHCMQLYVGHTVELERDLGTLGCGVGGLPGTRSTSAWPARPHLLEFLLACCCVAKTQQFHMHSIWNSCYTHSTRILFFKTQWL